jgi:hypothetical protein
MQLPTHMSLQGGDCLFPAFDGWSNADTVAFFHLLKFVKAQETPVPTPEFFVQAIWLHDLVWFTACVHHLRPRLKRAWGGALRTWPHMPSPLGCRSRMASLLQAVTMAPAATFTPLASTSKRWTGCRLCVHSCPSWKTLQACRTACRFEFVEAGAGAPRLFDAGLTDPTLTGPAAVRRMLSQAESAGLTLLRMNAFAVDTQ